MPEMPYPTEAVTLPADDESIRVVVIMVGWGLAKFERAEPGQGEDERENPEAQDHLGLRPALFLKMMMDGRHEEDPAPLARWAAMLGKLEPAHLNDDRCGLPHENASDNHERQRLLHHEGDHPNQPAER